MLNAPSKEAAIPTFRDLVNSRTVDYSGDEVGHALPLRLEELEPGLPLKGRAGALSAVEAATGQCVVGSGILGSCILGNSFNV